jgi:hypothetical protein
MLVRFLLGVVEGAVFPALVIFVSHWFSRSDALTREFIHHTQHAGHGAVDVDRVRLPGAGVRLAVDVRD